MKKTTGITAIKSRISFHKKTLRKFVNSRSVSNVAAINSSKMKRFLTNYRHIEFSSTLLPVNGRVDILLDAKHPEAVSKISIPVHSAFLVTCTQEGLDNYKVTWSCSLT